MKEYQSVTHLWMYVMLYLRRDWPQGVNCPTKLLWLATGQWHLKLVQRLR